jgi:hypothetical protein
MTHVKIRRMRDRRMMIRGSVTFETSENEAAGSRLTGGLGAVGFAPPTSGDVSPWMNVEGIT